MGRINNFDLAIPGIKQIARMNGCDVSQDGFVPVVVSSDGMTHERINIQKIESWVQSNRYGKIANHIKKLCESIKTQNIKDLK